jgi:hypothetical protein
MTFKVRETRRQGLNYDERIPITITITATITATITVDCISNKHNRIQPYGTLAGKTDIPSLPLRISSVTSTLAGILALFFL